MQGECVLSGAQGTTTVLRQDPGQLLTVRDVRIETSEAKTFELDVPEHLRQLYRGRAGQFLRITIPGDDVSLSRSYSLSNSPELHEPLRFTVKRVAGGMVSERLVGDFERGRALHVGPPAGAFVLKQKDCAEKLPLLLIAGGSGITPIFSLLKTVLHTTQRPVALLYSNRNRASAIFAAAIDELARAFPARLQVRHHFSDEEGFLGETDFRAFASSFASGHVYVCGPNPMMELVERMLGDGELSQRYDLVCERFISPTGNASQAPRFADPARVGASNIVLRLDGNEHACTWTGTGTLLDAALAAGIDAPFSCREGHCGACKARLVEGEVERGLELAISKRDRERGHILACCAVPRSRCIVIEYD
ncbi:MAG: iron-sulfur cluster-binding domain-containing protein [Variovorax sp.]